jgi:hypothetical protein
MLLFADLLIQLLLMLDWQGAVLRLSLLIVVWI